MASLQLSTALSGKSFADLRRKTPDTAVSGYFCQVRFLWRLARSCLRRLCLLIFDFRRFFSDPIVVRSG